LREAVRSSDGPQKRRELDVRFRRPIVRQLVEGREELAEERLEQTKRVLAHVAPIQAFRAESEKRNRVEKREAQEEFGVS
jgi:hypothetical protein